MTSWGVYSQLYNVGYSAESGSKQRTKMESTNHTTRRSSFKDMMYREMLSIQYKITANRSTSK